MKRKYLFRQLYKNPYIFISTPFTNVCKTDDSPKREDI